MNKKQVLNLLGLAKRAGKLVTGEDTVLKSLRHNDLKIVFVASDASKRQIDQFNKKTYFYEVKFNNNFTCDELSQATGKPMCKVLGITDQGFSESIYKNLEGGAENES